jgi:hypothetical protein
LGDDNRRAAVLVLKHREVATADPGPCRSPTNAQPKLESRCAQILRSIDRKVMALAFHPLASFWRRWRTRRDGLAMENSHAAKAF